MMLSLIELDCLARLDVTKDDLTTPYERSPEMVERTARMLAPKSKPLRLTGAKLTARNDRIDAREQQRCARCAVVIWNNGSRHHRKFRSRRGGDEVSNGLLMCGSGTTGCHGWAHANPADARDLGFAVHEWEDPRLVPVEHALHGLVYLDDEGGFSSTPPEGLGLCA